ncbi:helix-turn-helix domain-containing protein [Amycolatopsis saalfeldensis]|uniref:DNA binding domain-containing protein, excisionase family n=1 Tax=Amycolatopsis saalfeldensis TaxID=394193 RepID=A0A1H8Y3R4_9PSEU|nr:helix-turn-helix domain-containing protein [Amycolatopsis saalfeldensis]SEP46198.1 DNA binding domain-containing protein, excisionase family [Amycolatopsis saalfeldensis]
MTQELYSVEQVAERLGLHVRTVRGYVRDERLKAVRIGKQYRISAADLAAFTGVPTSSAAARGAEVTSIVELEGIDRAAAERLTTHVHGSIHGQGLRVETVHDPDRARLKLVVIGGLAAGADLLRLVADLSEGL